MTTGDKAKLLPCPCGAPVGAICKRPDCESPAHDAHMAAASDPGIGTRAPSPPASAEVAALANRLENIGLRTKGKTLAVPVSLALDIIQALRGQASGAAVQVPEGWQLVPKEPTSEMLKDGTMTLTMPWSSDLFPAGTDLDAAIMGATYAAMLAAAPQKQGA